jgi:hypothetical protein
LIAGTCQKYLLTCAFAARDLSEVSVMTHRFSLKTMHKSMRARATHRPRSQLVCSGQGAPVNDAAV